MEDISHIIDPLNAVQREAVAAPAEHLLILAGAGSGKTRVLVHRIAWILETQQASPHNILAVTFTNKAASEMQTRINQLLQTTTLGLWVGTFHGICHRLLRMHWQEARLPSTFQILDSDDQQRVIKRILTTFALDDKIWTPKQVQQFINNCKEQGLRSQHIIAEGYDLWLKQMLSLYQTYEEYCQKNGLVDFAELLLRTYETLRDNTALRATYQTRFRHVLVDEFQDTNDIQYKLLRILVGQHSYLFAVGDDDQSIYGWRGAKIENIQNLSKDYPAIHMIRLEQNYRSTGTILSVANNLIANNKKRLGKNLWTDGEAGEPVYLYSAYSEIDEAQFIVGKIADWVKKWQEVAILYRTSAQSRVFEEALIQKNIPYRIFGGLRFYERAEIKDVLAYLRLLHHRQNDTAFERIINLPKRGIGDKTLENLRAIARQHQCALWEAVHHAINAQLLTKRAATPLLEFVTFIDKLSEQLLDCSLSEKVQQIIQQMGLIAHYQKDDPIDAQRRQENLDELLRATQQFETQNKEEFDIVSAFLAQAALEAGEGQGSKFDDCVQLMTLHSAKGLEFSLVFLCGLEEGLFPHQNSLDEGNLEEERRLCYVGITRARQTLYLSHSETRAQYGQRNNAEQSRFIREIPSELLQEIRLKSAYSNHSGVQPSITLQVGDNVSHPTYGNGVIIEQEGQGELTRFQVRFAKGATKWLLLAYTRLEKC
ncbi:DNA helicase II [Beggiatoa leptomitoformis]|uniref:DNA 3'-5' helicase n=1 Tax=Beggiatoa leptomitoformis TaxID=288004 RepID=A0A650GCB6_9GAMM|nr:DNA helicase II [Beggiatoa leptomitoformis]ALG66601.1 DNA helicase II [Beggiatoa leptomitoformis]QGX04025.1 DNA helicase II [Beggiatoa leptomitoformis]